MDSMTHEEVVAMVGDLFRSTSRANLVALCKKNNRPSDVAAWAFSRPDKITDFRLDDLHRWLDALYACKRYGEVTWPELLAWLDREAPIPKTAAAPANTTLRLVKGGRDDG